MHPSRRKTQERHDYDLPIEGELSSVAVVTEDSDGQADLHFWYQ